MIRGYGTGGSVGSGASDFDAIVDGYVYETLADAVAASQEGWRILVSINETSSGMTIDVDNLEIVFKRGKTITSDSPASNVGITIDANYVKLTDVRLKDFDVGIVVNSGKLWSDISARFKDCTTTVTDNGTNTSIKEIIE